MGWRRLNASTGSRELIASAADLEGLVAQIASKTFSAEGFRIELLRTEGAMPVDRWEAIVKIANAIDALPNLSNPRHRFLLLVRENGLHFGEITVEQDRSYEQHMDKPWHTSSSLAAQMARALVNLASPDARSILDPCCGTGTILLEAVSLGKMAYGSDRNPRMVGMSRKNLAHFGYQAEVRMVDASLLSQHADAVVTDLPYGRVLVMEEANVRAILANCAALAPEGVFAAGADITPWLSEAGYADVKVLRVSKHNDFTRYIHQARSKV